MALARCDLDLIRATRAAVHLPIIASGE